MRERAATRNCASMSGWPRRARATSMCCSSTTGDTRAASTQHRRRTSIASCSGERTRRRALSMARPRGGTAYRPKPRATSGSGRASQRPGIGGSTRTRAVTVSGCRAACRIAIIAPIELPTRIAGLAITSLRNRCSICWLEATEVECVPASVRPKPIRSSATTRQVSVRRGASAAQLTSDPPNP